MAEEFHAWGDESVRLGLEEPSYLLGAAIARADTCDVFRERLRELKPRGPKLHWRDLGGARRWDVISAIADFDLVHVVVVAAPVVRRGQERARAICLERLVWELHDDGVSGLTLEARPASLMRRDIRTIDASRGKQMLPRGLRVEHRLPSEEPMLWVADQVLGAIGESMRGDDRWFAAIRNTTRIERIRL